MRFLVYYFWVAPHLLLLGVIFIALRSAMTRRFPLFVAYATFESLEFLLLFAMYAILKSPVERYELVALFCLGISIPLRLGVLYEVSQDLLAIRPALANRLGTWLRWTFGFLLIAGAAASATQVRAGVKAVENAFLSIEVLWSILVCGVVLALFLFTHKVCWASHAAGIAFGFGIFAAVNLATSGFREQFASRGNLTISVLQMAAFHVCVLVWLVYLLLPERSAQSAGVGLERTALEDWNQELQRIVRE